MRQRAGVGFLTGSLFVVLRLCKRGKHVFLSISSAINIVGLGRVVYAFILDLNIEVTNITKDNTGRVLIMDLKANTDTHKIVNVYMPVQFHEKITIGNLTIYK